MRAWVARAYGITLRALARTSCSFATHFFCSLSGSGRTITRTVKPQMRQRHYVYSYRSPRWTLPRSSIAEIQHGPERVGEMMRRGK